MTCEHRIAKARTTLLLDQPFFGALFYRLKLVADPSKKTMATDGVSLFYNPAFMESLAPAELVGVFAHEVMHPALHHHTRRGNRDPRLWNMAADYVINPLVLDAGLHLPKDVLNGDQYRGMSTEAIYNQLAKQAEDEKKNNPSSSTPGAGNPSSSGGQEPDDQAGSVKPEPVETPGGFGQVMDAPNPTQPGTTATPAQIAEQEQEWSAATVEATTISRMAGRTPGGVARAMEASAEAHVDWTDHLRRSFSSAMVPADYSWSRPNRRFAHTGLFLPSVQKEGVGDVMVAVDCSGSIGGRILGLFESAIRSLVEEHRPSAVHVLYFDETIHKHDTFDCGEPIDTLSPVGGGGTNFVPIFEYVADHELMPTTVIVLTDLYGRLPTEEPPYPVLWACTSRVTAPFGETIHMDAA
jgi:predicted metal-dependent peptidase